MSEWKQALNKNKVPITGVQYRDNPKRRDSGKADRYFRIRYSREGKTVSEGVGWRSEGITAQRASETRSDIVRNIRTGQRPQSLRESRALTKRTDEEREQQEKVEKQANMPLDALAQKYIDWAEDNKKSWKDDKARYNAYIKPIMGDIPIRQIATIQVEGLRKSLKKKKSSRTKKPLSDTTIKHCLVLLRQIFNRGRAWGLYEGANPVTETSKTHRGFLKSSDNQRARSLSEKEADKLLKALSKRSQQVHDISVLGLYAGLRAGEIFNLKWQDVDLNHGTLHIKNPKSGNDRTAYINQPIRDVLERRKGEAVKKTGLVFTTAKGGKIREVSNLFDRVVNDLKFNKGVTDTRDKVVFHTLRHTFASWLAMKGVPLPTIQKLMGHKSLEMTLRYSHLTPDHQRHAAELIAPGAEVVEIASKKAG